MDKARSGFHGRLSPLSQPDDLIENTLRDFPLCSFWDFDDLVVGDDGHFIAVGVKTDALASNVVYDDGIDVLGSELLAGVFEDIFGLGGEANNDLRLFAQRYFFQNVRGGFKLESERTFAFDLLSGDRLRAVIGNSGRFD